MSKKYIPKSTVAKIRKLSAFDYLHNYHPDLLIRNGRTDYIHAEHDSLHFSNGKWYWWSQKKGGTSALDYLVTVEGYTFMQACEKIMNEMNVSAPVISHVQEKPKKPFTLPPKDETNDDIIDYLCNVRMLDPEIVNYFIAKGQIYQSRFYKNVVFVGYDNKTPAYAFKRSITTDMKQEHAGSNKAFSFSFSTVYSDEVHVFEGAIDMLSYMTLQKMDDIPFYRNNCLSLGGATAVSTSQNEPDLPIALAAYLKRNGHIRKVVLHLDNDSTGIKAAESIQQALGDQYSCDNQPPIYFKDMNEQLEYRILDQKRKENP